MCGNIVEHGIFFEKYTKIRMLSAAVRFKYYFFKENDCILCEVFARQTIYMTVKSYLH